MRLPKRLSGKQRQYTRWSHSAVFLRHTYRSRVYDPAMEYLVPDKEDISTLTPAGIAQLPPMWMHSPTYGYDIFQLDGNVITRIEGGFHIKAFSDAMCLDVMEDRHYRLTTSDTAHQFHGVHFIFPREQGLEEVIRRGIQWDGLGLIPGPWIRAGVQINGAFIKLRKRRGEYGKETIYVE